MRRCQMTDNFNAQLKGIIPELYTEMLNNSALATIFNIYSPNGIDTTKFGRLYRVNYNRLASFKLFNPKAKVPVMFGRNIKIGNDLIYKIRIINRVLNHISTDEYLIAVHIIDLNVKKCHGMMRGAEKSVLFTDWCEYDPAIGDFSSFLFDTVKKFSNAKVIGFLIKRKEYYDSLKLAGSRL